MQSPIKTSYDFSLNALRRVLLCLCEYYQSQTDAKREKNYLWVPELLLHLLCLLQMKPEMVWNIFSLFLFPFLGEGGVRWFLVAGDFIIPQGQGCLLALGMMNALVWGMWTRAHGECHGRAGVRTALLEGHPVDGVWLLCWVAPWQPPGATREVHVACSCITGVPLLSQAQGEGIRVLKESQLCLSTVG